MKGFVLTAGLVISIVCGIGFADAANPVSSSDTETLRGIIQTMKASPRGPFQRIRWFCKDGTVHPARPYPCGERGGGVQHGEWSAQTRRLRSQGYYVANVLADIRPKRFIRDRQHPEIVRQMILEQFLISADDGWIFRQARYYRGSLQAEDEEKAGRELLKEMIRQWIWRGQRLPILREAARFLPHGQPEPDVVRMRQLSRNIAEKDRDFEALRVKLHVRPDAGDARKVRAYAARQGLPRVAGDYKTLAALLDGIYRAGNTAAEIRALAKLVKNRTLARMLRQEADNLSGTSEPEQRLRIVASLLRVLRRDFYLAGSSRRMLAVLDTSLHLEREFFRFGNQITAGLPRLTRRERLEWLRTTADALYGVYLISERQWQALGDTLHRLIQTRPLLNTYKSELDYLARVPGWADRFHSFYFSRSVIRLTTIEPLVSRYVHDRLHGSPLLFYSEVLDSLMADADQLIGVSHMMFSHQVSAGLRGLNPGLARGFLRFVSPGEAVRFERDGIYVLPATTENLPPVAGIITAGQGNALSHIQLLARNLGIPNVAVDQRLLPRLRSEAGQAVVLAVSPRGVVHLSRDSARWDPVFRRSRQTDTEFIVYPDMKKLDLRTKDVISLRKLMAKDSGRICGPKAANLGELKAHFPKAVTEGVVIPFGAYRTLLDQPFRPGGPSAFEWMRGQYAAIRAIEDQQKREAAESRFLEQMRNWITQADPGRDFRRRLRSAMRKTFGRSGTYGVFVRSDTNVEDLPGFTGAGLNLTVPMWWALKRPSAPSPVSGPLPLRSGLTGGVRAIWHRPSMSTARCCL